MEQIRPLEYTIKIYGEELIMNDGFNGWGNFVFIAM